MSIKPVPLYEELTITTGQLVKMLSTSFSKFASKRLINKHPSVFLLGQPGVGKSQSVYQIASNLGKKTKKQVHVADLRLILFNPVDMRGIPIADLESETAIWLKPESLNLNDSEDITNILFLDELTSAPQSIQAAAYQIALERRIGEHRIPNNTFIIAAGNRLEDESVTYDMPAALKNRFMHFRIKSDYEDWKKWALDKKIHPLILRFLDDNPNMLKTDKFDTESNIIVTPRSWEMLSNILKTLGGSLKDNMDWISAIVGVSMTHLMLQESKGLRFIDILNGSYSHQELSLTTIQSLTSIIISEMSSFIEDRIKTQNIMQFMQYLPTDFAIQIFKNMLQYEYSNYQLSDLDGYRELLQKVDDLDD